MLTPLFCNANLAATTKTTALQNVNVIHAELGSPVTDLTVPGFVQAYSESPVFARISGYVRVWNADIDHHPAVIAHCRSAADVVAAVRFAAETSGWRPALADAV